MTDRVRLPSRRPCVTIKIEHMGMETFITMGINTETNEVMEVFGSAKKTSTDLDYLVADACVALSIAFQRGATPEELLHSMHWVPDLNGHRSPASLIGKVVRAILFEQMAMSSEPEL